MQNPIILFVIALTSLLVAAILWPKHGLLSRWRAWRSRVQRQQMEDALKVIFNHQNEGRVSTLDTLAGALSLTQPRTLTLASRMHVLGLVELNGRDLLLTPEGQRWALQVVRAHRLWERYLADEARMPLNQIHTVAHQREHGMTAQQVDELDASLGFPARDPHGDPIPGPSGSARLPGPAPDDSSPLSSWKTGQRGQVVELEDEPPVAYAQLIAAGVHIGQTVTLLESNRERVVLTDGETEITFAPAIAANIRLRPLPENASRPSGVIPLSQLASRTLAEIVELDPVCQGFTRRRFLDLGLTPGTRIAPELDNAFREPRAYRVRGTLIALRNDQAALVWVRPQPSA